MTTTDDLLMLARKVYGDKVSVNDTDLRTNYRGVFVPSRHWNAREDRFDPANNAEQFCDVLAWLLMQKPTLKQWFELNEICVVLQHDEYDVDIADWFVLHDGTAASIRAAVTEAVVRVARGMA